MVVYSLFIPLARTRGWQELHVYLSRKRAAWTAGGGAAAPAAPAASPVDDASSYSRVLKHLSVSLSLDRKNPERERERGYARSLCPTDAEFFNSPGAGVYRNFSGWSIGGARE